jgi:hypothetical protein
MRVIVYPRLARNTVGDATVRLAKVPTVFREQHERLVEDELVNRALYSIRAVVGIWSSAAIRFGDRAAFAVEELDDFTKPLDWKRSIDGVPGNHFSIPSSSFMPC